MKEVKLTAYGRGQAHSKWKWSNAQQIKDVKQEANQLYQDIKRTPNQTITAPQNAIDSKNQNHIFWTNEQCSEKQNIYGPAKRTK